MSNLLLCCEVKSKQLLNSQIQSLTLLQCLPQMVKLVASLRTSLRITVLEEEWLETTLIKAEEGEDTITMVVHNMPFILFRTSHHRIFSIKALALLRIPSLIVHHANLWDFKLQIVIIGWIFLLKAKILLLSLLPWLVLLMQPSQTIRTLGLQIQVLLIILLQTLTIYLYNPSTKVQNKSLLAMV